LERIDRFNEKRTFSRAGYEASRRYSRLPIAKQAIENILANLDKEYQNV